MTIAQLKILGVTALAWDAFALDGMQTFGHPSGLGQARSRPRPCRMPTIVRPPRSARPMRPLRPLNGSPTSSSAILRNAAAGEHRLQLYMVDLVEGGTTLLADEPDPGLDYCNAPKWSNDGTRIVFFARSWTEPRPSCIKAIEVSDGRPTLMDLGPGHCPTLSPDDKRIAFLLNPGEEPGAEGGIWLMEADGSGRRQVVGRRGFPLWSPDRRRLVINQDNKPTESIVINLETREEDLLEMPGHWIHSWPTWAGPETLVSSIGTRKEADAIVLLDVRKPAEARIIETLWSRSEDLDVEPLWAVYSPATRRCAFVGAGPGKRTLYSVQRGVSRRARPLEPEGYDDRLSGLWFSPDGRYLLFCANRPDRR